MVGVEDVMEMIKRPRITEKATMATGHGAYVFEVDPRATKTQIKDAVQKMYKVTPRKINIVRMRPQRFFSRMRGRRGMTRGMKKAYVYLNEGDTIDLV